MYAIPFALNPRLRQCAPLPRHPDALPCSMSLASSLLLLGAGAYLVAASTALTAVDYRHLVGEEEQQPSDGLPGRGNSGLGLLEAAVEGEHWQQQRQQQQSNDGDEESGEAGAERSAGVPASQSVPLLPSGAQRSS